MKTFPLIDIVGIPKYKSLKRPSQLLLIGLIAHYHERQRTSGKDIIHDTHQEGVAEYKVVISRNELQRKFSFSKRLLIRTDKELREKGVYVSKGRLLSIDCKYRRKHGVNWFRNRIHDSFDIGEPWESSACDYDNGVFRRSGEEIEVEQGIKLLDKKLLPYVNIEAEYCFGLGSKGRNIVDIPVKVIYDKVLSISEKLAIIWKLILEKRLNRNLTLFELEAQSGISERVFRKAKKHYPGLFRKRQLSA